ncbi:MAG: alpha-glucuronidase family glycosyl hydrolase [Pirellulales bacterium]
MFARWKSPLAFVLGMLLGCAGAGGVAAAEQITVVVGTEAPRLERFAAQELAAQFKQLFDSEVTVADAGAAAAAAAEAPTNGPVVLIGNPQTNAAIRKVVGDAWPELTDQGFVIKTFERDGRTAIVVGGDRPVATLWGVYELGQRFGVRYLLAGDVYPAESPALRLTGFDVVAEPALATRAWQAIDDMPIGSSAWGLAEHKRVLGQLAKLKFNRVILNVYPWQPFVDFEVDGIRKSTAELFYGWKFPVDGDTAGRSAFQGAHEFTNPDLAGKSSSAERTAAGKLLLGGIIAAAHELGMSVGLRVSPLEFPPEFAPLLAGAEPCGPEKLTVGPGPRQSPDDERLQQLAAEQLLAYVRSHTQVDAIYISTPRVAFWTQHAPQSWERISQQIPDANRSTLEALLSRVKTEHAASGESAAARVETQIAALFALDRLPEDDLRRHPSASGRSAYLAGIDPALAIELAKIPQLNVGMLLSFGDLGDQSAAAKQLDELSAEAPVEPAEPKPAVNKSLAIGLASTSASVLPQSAMSTWDQLLRDLAEHHWAGYAVDAQMPGDIDYRLHYLAQAGWNASQSPDEVLDELVTPMCGAGVTERVALALSQIEAATRLINEQDTGFAALGPDMVMKHYAASEPPPEHWQKLQELYGGAMNEMYRAHDRSHLRGRPFLRYYCKRLEFAVEYMASVQALRRAGAAKSDGDQEAQIAELERATESMYNALSALSEVARDSGDRGAIAALNAWGFRPLQQALADADAQ